MAEFRRHLIQRITKRTIRIRQIDAMESEMTFDDKRWTMETEVTRMRDDLAAKSSDIEPKAAGGNSAPGIHHQWTVNTIHNVNNYTGQNEPANSEREEVQQDSNKPVNGSHRNVFGKTDRRKIGAEVAAKAAAHSERFQGILLYVFQVETALALTDEELVKLHQLMADW